MVAIRDHPLGRIHHLVLRDAEIIVQKSPAIGAAHIVCPLQVRLPLADVLVVGPIDHVLAQREVGLIRAGIAGEQTGRNQVRLLDSRPLLPATTRREDLVLEPREMAVPVA